MEPRRGARTLIDPKVRQVGFVTPAPPLMPHPSSPLPSTTPAAPADDSVSLGSFNFTDTVLRTSQSSSEKTGNSVKNESVAIDSLGDMSMPTVLSVGNCLEGLSIASDGASSVPPMSVLRSLAPVSVERASQTVSGSMPTEFSVNATSAVTVAKPQAGIDSGPKPAKDKSSKAERRALQEAQRAAKAASKGVGKEKVVFKDGNDASQAKSSKPPNQKTISSEKKLTVSFEKKPVEKAFEKEKRKDIPAPRMQFDDEQRVAKAKRRSLIEQTETKNRVELFRHLPQFLLGTQLPSLESKFFYEDPLHPHPSVFQVGLKYLNWDIVGGNARCIAMLMAFRDMISEYSTPSEKTLVRDLTAKLNSHVSFLINCRPISISMGNAIKFLKTRIANFPVTLSETEAKSDLILEIDRFIQEKIVFADNAIVKLAVTKIRDGDVLLTHGSSCVIEMIFVQAHELGKKFQVVVVDSRPRLEGKGFLRRLLERGLQCTYTHINAISYAIQGVTRVFLGAASILSNGTVYSRVGTACVAMVAHALGVPVMICCETYKFHERVQLDSICSNELGDPDALVEVHGRKDVGSLNGWADSKQLHLLNLMYDATPADYVSMIITELGMVPPTSVAVILREYRKLPYVM